MEIPNLPPHILILIALWSLAWKGFALWHASRREEKVWFVLMLFINTLGILELIYLTFKARVFAKKT